MLNVDFKNVLLEWGKAFQYSVELITNYLFKINVVPLVLSESCLFLMKTIYFKTCEFFMIDRLVKED